MGQFLMSTRIYTGEASLEEIEHLGLKRAYIICDPLWRSADGPESLLPC